MNWIQKDDVDDDGIESHSESSSEEEDLDHSLVVNCS